MSEEIKKYRASEVWDAVEKNSDCGSEQLVRFSDHEAALAAERKRCREEEVEPLCDALSKLIARIDYSGGIGEYKGGPAFVMKNARSALTAVQKIQEEKP